MQIIIKSLFQLFEKDNNWSPNCTYIYIISIFFNLLDYAKFYSNSLDNSKRPIISDLHEQTRQELIIKKICEKINKNIVNIIVDFNKKMKKEDVIKYRKNLERKLEII